MQSSKPLTSNELITTIFFLTFVIALSVSFYRYSLKENYDYIVESPCDSSSEICYFRDCVNSPDDCPPNNLSYYKVSYIKAYDFPKCGDNSCSNECKSGSISCVPVSCDEANGDTCKSNLVSN